VLVVVSLLYIRVGGPVFTCQLNARRGNGNSVWLYTINVRNMRLSTKSKFGLPGLLWTSFTFIQHNSLSSQSSVVQNSFWFYHLRVQGCLCITIVWWLLVFIWASMSCWWHEVRGFTISLHLLNMYISILAYITTTSIRHSSFIVDIIIYLITWPFSACTGVDYSVYDQGFFQWHLVWRGR
jgi:hypothetical protein